MKWPWIPRSAFDAVVAERDRLIAQNEKLIDHTTRMSRVEHGRSEEPRAARQTIQEMPRDLFAHFAAFENKSIGRLQRAEAYRRHAQGTSWLDISKDAMPPEPEEPR
jgi:hypothetical protein